MMHEITNCTWKFKFQCPRMWSGLRETGDPKVRMCESCLREVHLCETDEEVAANAAKGNCVAIGFMTPADTENMLLGDVIVDP